MKHYRTENVPATTHSVLTHATCDLCGQKIARLKGNADEVEVKHRTGSAYPEGGGGEEVSVDLCGPCFDGKLIPWLESQGAKPTHKDWEF